MATTPRTLIGPSSFGALDDRPLRKLRDRGCEIVPNPVGRRYTKPEIISLLDGIDGLIAGLEPLDREVLSGSELKVVSRCGSGVSNVDLEAAEELGIVVCNTPDGPTQAVAEMTLGALLSISRHMHIMNRSLHDGRWDKRIGGQLADKNVAIVGYGRIGRRFAALLAPFDVDVMVVDPYIDVSNGHGRSTSLDEALETADVISLHLSGEQCILDTSAFNKMRSGVLVLNAARGGNVDEQALVDALESGTVAAAWLDSLPREPYEGPLTQYEQVLLTPHAASYTREGRLNMEMQCVENLLQHLSP